MAIGKVFLKMIRLNFFFILIIVTIGITAVWLLLNSSEKSLYVLRISTFNVTSILTGTGYSSSNYSEWGGFGLVILSDQIAKTLKIFIREY